MTAKEYLQQYGTAMRRTRAISDHLAELRALCEQLRTEDGHRVALDAAVANLVDTERQTAAEVSRLCKLETEIACTIDRMPEPYRTLLYERYINGKTWEQIAVGMNYSYVHTVHRLHPSALRAVQEILTQSDQ
ncbi:MAG: sigma-70 family RNA polymerase sigma factor [Oscillospiraceae bacterium]|nr:sigma-70 family RNA polymerase sigma factor [Oscillospiraceae bacterium]